MRILIVHYNLDNHNPTVRKWPYIFKHFADIDFFGPGFVSEKVLKEGLKNFLRKNDPYDIVAASEHILYNTLPDISLDSQYNVYRRGYISNFNLKLSLELNRKLFDDFLEIEAIKCLTMFEFDCYNMRESHYKLLNQLKNIYVIGWGQQFLPDIDDSKALSNELFSRYANNRWLDFVSKSQHRVISMPAFVSSEEFSWSPLTEKKYKWCVPGTDYWARKKAIKVIKNLKIKVPDKTYNRIFSLLDHLYFHPYANPLLVKFYNYCFSRMIESSKYVYTCGSNLGFPVRKFFEIPALGSVLACMPCNGFKDLGFIDKINAVSCMPDDIGIVHDFLESNTDLAQEIAANGRKLIWERHTVQARARQLAISFASIQNKKFMGSYWENGDFYIREKDGPKK